MEDLERKIKVATGNIFIVTESIFSMDGDICPLEDMIALSEKYSANVIIDEAHSTGIVGQSGEGLTQLLGFEAKVFARIHTFGKAVGTHGAAVVGSTLLKNYLINFARSFVFSTALPPTSVLDILNSYKIFPALDVERKQLETLISLIQDTAKNPMFTKSRTPIQSVIIPGNKEVKRVSAELRNAKLDVRPILYPTVPKGLERLRVVLHAFNTPDEVDLLLKCLKNSR
jgi:8-amino-7-oxononanoate synthase